MLKVVLFSRVPRWYSFKNERLARKLTADGHEVCGVVVEQTSLFRSIKEWRDKLGWDVFIKKATGKLLGKKDAKAIQPGVNLPEVSPKVFFVKSHNSQECVDVLKKLSPDLIVLRGCGILKKDVLDVPRIGVINPHYAKLPDFRGMDVTEWSVVQGADVAVSVHTVNTGVDTGVVLKSKLIDVSLEDTVGSLRDKSATAVVELLAEAVSDIANGAEFPKDKMIEDGGHQYFKMHPRIKELANLKLNKLGNS